MQTGVEQRIGLGHPVVECSERGARSLAEAYWDELSRLTLGLVRARPAAGGGVEIALGRRVPLLRFGPPATTASESVVECRYPIEGGLLAKRSGGSLALLQVVEPSPELAVVVEGYAPRLDSGRPRGLRTLTYHEVQERIHSLIGRRYLERMAGRRP
jgi:hypothetical protein